MNLKMKSHPQNDYPTSPIYSKGAFSRLDESDDRIFYSQDRFVSHLDTLALATLEKLIGELIIEENPLILDLMAGWDSHIPKNLNPSKVVGLGLNENELKENDGLSEIVIHDLNRDPILPFQDDYFDAVINTVSVDYMIKPIAVFSEIGRILKPGGLFLVVFSNRMFPQKVVRIWRESSEDELVLLVEEFFHRAELFEKPSVFVSKGKPRPEDDKYAHLGIPSDPVYAVYAEKKGGNPSRKARPIVTMGYGESLDQEVLQKRKKAIRKTLQCPYCGEKMRKWAVPDNPFANTWTNEFMYICFNDACPYFVRGWDSMFKQGNRGASYRLMYNPEKDTCGPVPVPSPRALKEGIIE
jgi:SAM-dependent methyltransferase